MKYALCALAAMAYMSEAAADGVASGSTPVFAGDAAAPAVAVVPPAPNEYVDMVKQNFHFKKTPDIIERDERGNPVKDAAGKEKVLQVGAKHPTVTMYLPVPKRERLIEILSDPVKFAKENELLSAAVFDVVYIVARGQVNDAREKDPTATITPAVLNFDKLDWTAIANTPKSERGAYAPSDEELKAFLSSYKELMPAIASRKPEQIQIHVDIIGSGFKRQRNDKPMLEFFGGMFQLYCLKAGDDNVEEHKDVLDYFVTKLDKWLKAEEKITMDML